MNRTECTGCSACYLRCPTKAISMQEDFEGFKYPLIDNTKCISCGLCEKVCHLNTVFPTYEKQIAYAAVNNDINILRFSSSGGMFSAIAEFIINQGGVCFGVCQDIDQIYYACASEISGVEKMRGSKYVQTDMNDIFQYVEHMCKLNKYVLFTGTPCQVAGVKAFLRKDYPKFFTLDIVCHGVPSRLFFKQYLNFLENRLGACITKFNFRDKSRYGVSCISSCCYEKNGKKINKVLTNQLENYYYYYMFADSYRESCYHCHYNNLNRPSDITVGDFWGIEKLESKLDTKFGCSAVIINSAKGLEIISNLKCGGQCTFEEHSVDEITSRNTALVTVTKRPSSRNDLYCELKKFGFSYAVSGRYKLTHKKYLTGLLKGILPPSVQKIIHKYL